MNTLHSNKNKALHVSRNISETVVLISKEEEKDRYVQKSLTGITVKHEIKQVKHLS